MKIYLDACCFNRPFDDQRQTRIRLESEAVLIILERIKNTRWTWISSEVLHAEILQTPDEERRARVFLLASESQDFIELEIEDLQRAKQLELLGLKGMDALHIACAERATCDVFLSTDDQLLRIAGQKKNQLRVVVMNPLKWLEEVME